MGGKVGFNRWIDTKDRCPEEGHEGHQSLCWEGGEGTYTSRQTKQKHQKKGRER